VHDSYKKNVHRRVVFKFRKVWPTVNR